LNEGERTRGTIAVARSRIVLLAAVASLLATAIALWSGWPDVAALATKMPGSTAFIDRYEERLRRAGKKGSADWRPVAYSRIAPELKVAVLVAEDIDFFSHEGFAVGEMKLALEEAWKEGEAPRGASTITQQLAKNLWLSPSRNPLRKMKEALLTRSLELELEKRRILEIYLNVVEFGPGIYGAEAASRRYFGVAASALSRRQAAELAAALPKPSVWHPGSTSRVYLGRIEKILRRMDSARWLEREI
jgi:monofunctional biosynthetic peptidoglycan transglycosylase